MIVQFVHRLPSLPLDGMEPFHIVSQPLLKTPSTLPRHSLTVGYEFPQSNIDPCIL